MDAYLIVDPDSRNITIPEVESAFGVYGDNNAERKYFKAPRIVGNGIDLTECYLYVNYISASTKIGQILCDVGDAPNGTATEDEIVFSWPITRNVLDKNVSGEIFFAVQAKTKTGDTVFTTRKAKGNCYESIEGTEVVAEEYADIVLQLISRMDNVEANIGEQVAAYFKENPAVTAEYLDQTLQPVKNDVSQLKEDLGNVESVTFTIEKGSTNVFDYTNITSGKILKQDIGISTSETYQDSAKGFVANQTWNVKKGDVIYTTSAYCGLCVYDANGVLKEHFNDGNKNHTITVDSAHFLRLYSSASSATYTTDFMLSIDEPLPSTYEAYKPDKKNIEFHKFRRKNK